MSGHEYLRRPGPKSDCSVNNNNDDGYYLSNVFLNIRGKYFSPLINGYLEFLSFKNGLILLAILFIGHPTFTQISYLLQLVLVYGIFI